MGLTSDLLSQFVKVTKDTEPPKKETTAYGTAVVEDGKVYVCIDGSDQKTPVSNAAVVKDGDRVIVLIKNHEAIITGNLSSPAAGTQHIDTVIDKLDAKYVETQELEAAEARIKTLETDNVTVKGRLDAHDASIDGKLDASVANITYASIKDLEATNEKVYNLEGVYGDFTDLTAENFKAVDADIEALDAKYAEITDLKASKADVEVLDAEVADINTLIFGSASGESIHSSFANAVIAQLGDAQIKSAMIDSVAADKITAGDIITNDVRVLSEDGKLIISDETIQISDDNRVRVQIGKDASNDYSINVWDADGNLMFSKGGITDSAIKEAIIRNDMVSDTANISAHKLDIDSLFEEINGSAKTIKSTKVSLDDRGQTLDVAFESMTTDVAELGETVTAQGTELSAVQGQISSKVWEQDITDAINDMEVGGRNYILDSEAEKTGYDTSYPVYNFIEGTLSNLLGKDVTVSFDAKADDSDGTHDIDVYLRNYDGVIRGSKSPVYTLGTEYVRYSHTFKLTESMMDAIQLRFRGNAFVGEMQNMNPTKGNFYVRRVKMEAGNKATDWTPAPEDVENDISTLSTKYSSIEQTVDSISTTVAEHTTEIENKADNSTVTEVSNKVTTLEQDLDGFQTTVSSSYATKSELEVTNDKLENSKLGNLIRNGYGEYFDNTNFNANGMGRFVREACPGGAYGYFNNAQTERIPFNPNLTYRYRYYCRLHAGRSGDSYFSIIPYDVDGNKINTINVLFFNKNLFYLAEDLNDGDTVVKFTDLTKWMNASAAHQRSFLVFNYTDSTGYRYPDGTYSRNRYHNVYSDNSSVDKVNHTITLTSPWANGKLAAGTCIGQSAAGASNCYYGQTGAITNTDWKEWTSMFKANAAAYNENDLKLAYAHSIVIHLYNNVGDYCSIYLGEEPYDQIARSDAFSAKQLATAAQTKIAQNSEAIALRATKTEVETAKTEAIASANGNTAELLNSYSTTAEMNAAIELSADGITSSVASTYATKESIDNIKIGGRNYILNSEAEQIGSLSTYPIYYFTETMLTDLLGEEVTVSFEGKADDTDGTHDIDVYFRDSTSVINSSLSPVYTLGTEYVRYSYTFTITEPMLEALQLRVRGNQYVGSNSGMNSTGGDFYVRRVKLEVGNKATDWTPAPEDIDARLSTAESSITQLSDRITSNVTETTELGTRMSTVEQTAEGLTVRLDGAEDDILDAGKTATDYIEGGSDGLIVGDMTTNKLGKNVRIASTGVEVRDGETVAASFEADKVSLGRNAEESEIDLCGGAGRISANTASASTSYPHRNAILIDSQEIETESVRFVATATNEYGAGTEPTVTRMAQLYMLRSPDSETVSNARIEAEHYTNADNTYVSTGFSALTYDNSSNTRALIYANDSKNKIYNQVNVYKNKTTMSKPLFINGTEFSGNNKVLWSGVYYMNDTQTATLSEAISAQANGIALIWSYYTDGAADNSNFHSIFVPKHFVSVHNGKGLSMFLTNASLSIAAGKYLYISDTSIKGYSNNDANAAAKDSGLTATPKNFVLRYVIGV